MSRTILLADDSVTIQKVIELTFMDEDYEVVAVGNGDDALEQLDEITPDFVIADVHMPGASGYDVAKHSKSLRPEVPVLLLVGTFEPFDEELAEKSGCDAYLKKPFDSQELQRLVDELSAEAARDLGPLEATGWRAQAPPSADPGEAAQAADAGAGPAAGMEGAPAEPLRESQEDGAATPFSIGLEDEDETPSTQVEPPAEPRPEAGGSAAPADEPVFDFGEGHDEGPAAIPAEPPVFGELAGTAAGAPAEPELPTGPAAGETAPPELGSAAAPASAVTPPASAEAPASGPDAAGEAPAAGPLSDEDVERIARRIVELVGDRAIRDVAWEVVPDLAEVVIRGRLRELESHIESVE